SPPRATGSGSPPDRSSGCRARRRTPASASRASPYRLWRAPRTEATAPPMGREDGGESPPAAPPRGVVVAPTGCRGPRRGAGGAGGMWSAWSGPGKREAVIAGLAVLVVVLGGIVVADRWPDLRARLTPSPATRPDAERVAVLDVVLDRERLRTLDVVFDRPLG